jgi:hypothetical protein
MLIKQLMDINEERKMTNHRLDGAEVLIRQQIKLIEAQEEELRKRNVAEADEEAKRLQAEEAAKNGEIPEAIKERIGVS